MILQKIMSAVFDVPVKDMWFKVDIEQELKRHSLTLISLKELELKEGENGKLRETYVKVSEVDVNGSNEAFIQVGEYTLEDVN
uniref:Prophage_tailD1 domain-containing protein n=1 Tax=Caenorhabditis tropicalis TaxID=1561998 RepID=A0A1I7UPR5_9PELO